MAVIAPRPALGLAYFTYFGVLGIFVPYLGLFLDGRGLNSQDIGLMMAIVTATRIVGPSVWAWRADRSGRPLQIMRTGAILACLGWLCSFVDQGFWLLLAGLALFTFCWTAILPQLEVSAFHFLDDNTQAYSRIRTSGSVGYILLVLLGGWLSEHYGSNFLPGAALAFLLLLLGSLFLLPDFSLRNTADEPRPAFKYFLKQSLFWRFMGATFLLQMSFAPFYVFFTLYCRDLGYSGTQTGLLIGLAVLAEIVAFYFAGSILKNRSYRLLLSCCYGLTAIRWLMVAELGGSGWWLACSMLFHAASFAIAHSCAMQFVQGYFPRALRSRGQALYAGVIFGGGGAVGAYVAGVVWQDGAGATTAFELAATMAFAAMLLALTLPARVSR
ncbi:MFS transporter [Chromatiaceae bacterium AAb-1]|nr:MFS transporter [Chromatiaceae bacterium AAb-1]